LEARLVTQARPCQTPPSVPSSDGGLGFRLTISLRCLAASRLTDWDTTSSFVLQEGGPSAVSGSSRSSQDRAASIYHRLMGTAQEEHHRHTIGPVPPEMANLQEVARSITFGMV
ncbi:unnamed protein product, partial [Heterosigma akashiwo]